MPAMTPAIIPTTGVIFRNAMLRMPYTQEALLKAQKSGGSDLQASLDTLRGLEDLLATPVLGRGMQWWLRTVAGC